MKRLAWIVMPALLLIALLVGPAPRQPGRPAPEVGKVGIFLRLAAVPAGPTIDDQVDQLDAARAAAAEDARLVAERAAAAAAAAQARLVAPTTPRPVQGPTAPLVDDRGGPVPTGRFQAGGITVDADRWAAIHQCEEGQDGWYVDGYGNDGSGQHFQGGLGMSVGAWSRAVGDAAGRGVSLPGSALAATIAEQMTAAQALYDEVGGGSPWGCKYG